ncbi:Leucine Rich Repeat [Seminavis robusta]|uniref:Leucine Rich Repeat n=1 Tax=Seminavis robusta TaxID=568900 RepID=A0A9N8DKV2_9STRA|nr:Leucine Rich Repeat [Seminavis robusta]|eukprot:Sro210_g087740.1 Leucine Rich Repeat (812) ;mRNA; f:73667-76180
MGSEEEGKLGEKGTAEDLDVFQQEQSVNPGDDGGIVAPRGPDEDTTPALNMQAEKEAASISVGAALAAGESPSDCSQHQEPHDLEIANKTSYHVAEKHYLSHPQESQDFEFAKENALADYVSKEHEQVSGNLPRLGHVTENVPSLGQAPEPPTLTVQRNINRRPTTPGAVAIGGNGHISMDSVGPPPENHPDTLNTNSGTNQPVPAMSFAGQGMPSAQLVNTDEEANIQNADPVQEGDLRLSMMSPEESKTNGKEAFKVIFLIGIAGFIVLGLVLGLTGEKDAADVVPTTAPTVVPSAAPTSFAATLGLPDYTQEAILNDENSPQARAFSWLMEDPNFETYPDWRVLQRLALASFYYSTGGPNWSINDNWLNHSLDECKHWFFLTETAGVDPKTRDDIINVTSPCNASGRYQYLLMGGKGLTGSVPREIGMLSELLIFDFEKNFGLEYSTIPSEIGLLTNLLRMSADRNYLAGTVPTEIGLMTSMVELYLGYNPFPSTIPTEIVNMRELKKINLNRAGFTGAFPSELYTLPKMEVFLVHGLLGITEATLEGVWQMTDLEGFYAHNLPFHNTPIPSELGLATKLQRVNLWDTGLTGTVPSELANLSVLRGIDIDDNYLTGPLPVFLLELTTHQMIWWEGNFFTGTLPSHVWEHLPSLETVFLAGNLLSGTIPTEVGLAQSVAELYLYHNAFTGTLPTEMGNLTTLKHMFIHNTELSGTISPELNELPNLDIISLSNTLLTGSIPERTCNRLAEVSWGCKPRFRVVTPICYDVVEVMDFNCSKSLLCGCLCKACPDDEGATTGGFVFNMTFDP